MIFDLRLPIFDWQITEQPDQEDMNDATANRKSVTFMHEGKRR